MIRPDFENLRQVLRREVPARPTLFEFFLNERLYQDLSGFTVVPAPGSVDYWRMRIGAFANAGYDYATVAGSSFAFPSKETDHKASRSVNESTINDWATFEAYPWPDPEQFDYSPLDTLAPDLPDGMKLIVCGPGGVLENVMWLVGYETLCYILIDEPDLGEAIFTAVGSRLLRYYELSAAAPTVGALISNDDWGFNTQTMLSPDDMRRYVFPWHKKIVAAIHAAGKPAILHSCGNLSQVMDDLIDDIGYDGKHSYEDKILPVEDAYEAYHDRIAILGGIDLDFVCRATPDDITARCRAMFERAATRGGYALGTGNSVPPYVPDENYFAMTRAALENRG